MPFTYHRRVAFAETDMAGIVHFAHYNRFMEEAEHAFFRHVGVPMIRHEADGTKLSWPRVRAACDFIAPATYDDVIDVELTVARIGEKSLAMTFQFLKQGKLLGKGELATVYCRFRPGQPLESLAIPSEYRERFEKG